MLLSRTLNKRLDRNLEVDGHSRDMRKVASLGTPKNVKKKSNSQRDPEIV